MTPFSAFLRGLAIGAFSFAGSVATAFWFGCVLALLQVPPDDSPGPPLLAIPIASHCALTGFLVVSPFAFALLWGASLRHGVPLAFAAAFAWIGIVTPIDPQVAFFGSPVVPILAMALCRGRFPRKRRTEPSRA